MKRPVSLRARLLAGILAPALLLVAIDSVGVYRSGLAAATTAYDRTLLASAKTIGEQLTVEGYDEAALLRATVPYSALEAFEADNQSRMYYRVSALDGEMVSGFAELPFWRGVLPARPPYAALVDFYDSEFRGRPVRVAVLLQPVTGTEGRGMAVVQVAETLELRRTMARRLLRDTLWRQLLLCAVIAGAVLIAVQRATRPVRQLGQAIRARATEDLSPIDAPDAPAELQPLINATTQAMGRLRQLLDHRKRFLRDSAHQLRTPLAVLKTQVQSALRGDLPPSQALGEIAETVERATVLADRMLSLARVEQSKLQPGAQRLDLAEAMREVALELSPLIGERGLDFELHAPRPVPVLAHGWMLHELGRNLLHNAIRHSPPGAVLELRVEADEAGALLVVRDQGPGIPEALRQRLFEPFAAGGAAAGSGLGLAICREIVAALEGCIALVERESGGRILGLDACVHLPRPSDNR